MNDGIEVARIDATGGVQKYPQQFSTPNWGFPVVYTLSTGQRCEGRDKGYSRKKDAVAAHAKLPAIPPSNPTSVVLDENGEMYMVRMSAVLYRSPELKPSETSMRALLVDHFNGRELTSAEIDVAKEFIAQGPRIEAGEYLPNYRADVAERVRAHLL